MGMLPVYSRQPTISIGERFTAPKVCPCLDNRPKSFLSEPPAESLDSRSFVNRGKYLVAVRRGREKHSINQDFGLANSECGRV
jgi:hypothetical protein